jgi:glyoxylase I family protein
MFKIVGLDHIVLNTQKAENLINFYCNVLGCTIEREQPDLHLTQLRAGDNIIDIVENKAYVRLDYNNLKHFCLKINPFNYEECIVYFNKHDIQLYRYGERFGAQGKVHSFYLRDPDGNEIELCELKK